MKWKPKIGDLLFSGNPNTKYSHVESIGMITDITEDVNVVYKVEWYVYENKTTVVGMSYYSLKKLTEFRKNYEKYRKNLK